LATLTHTSHSVHGSDRFALDNHPYFAFDGAPLATPQTSPNTFPSLACQAFGPPFQSSQTGFGVTLAGEFSGGINDCGLFLHGPTVSASDTTYEQNGGNCDDWTVWENWSDTTKNQIQNFVEAQMDAMSVGGGWFFWTWKIGPGQDGKIRSPAWSYQLGLENG
jgi:glucan 1,3-beta-glucosidase